MENYNPDTPVCDNQDDFNIAFQKANRYNIQQQMKKDKPYSYVYFVLLCIFILWAILIVMKSPSSSVSNRIVQLVFAIVFSPFYVVSYYLSMLSDKNNSVSMGMCGCSKQI